MSSANSVSTPAQSRRRFHARRRIEGLIYVDLGPDNGAILIDLSEGGLCFQSVVPVSLDENLLLKFKVPGESDPVEGHAAVAWLNESGKSGGLRFVELNSEARAQIRGFAGELAAPQPEAPPAENSAEPQRAQESAIEASSARVTDPSTAPETSKATTPKAPKTKDAPSQISETFAAAESDRGPSLEAGRAVHDSPPEAQSFVPGPSPLPEFAIEIAAGADASALADTNFESPLPIALTSATVAPEGSTSRSPQSAEQDRRNDALEAAASEISREPAPPVQTPEFAPEMPTRAAAPPPKPARPQAYDPKNLAQALKHPRKPASAKPEPSLPAYRQDSAARGSGGRQTGQMGQSAKPAPLNTDRQNLLDKRDEFKPRVPLLSQALKVAIGAGAGACLVLVLIFAIPSLRTLVQTTANARSAGLNLANAPAFQVEVADLNNRRWILRSGGDAGSPFSDTPSRRETQSNPANAGRRESAKSSRSDESNDSAETPAAPQPKLAKPSELALSRPVPKPANAPAGQPPSIFDGITPPVGSLTDRLPANGPDVSGIVQPASPAVKGPSALQSAVLLQRVAPVYPSDALGAKVQGEVIVNATIGKDGVPKDLKVIKGDQRLVGAAFTAIRQWRYSPATLGGVAIETQTTVTVAFELK